MRVVLVLCLLAFMSCQKDIMDIAKCLYESPKVKEIIADVMVAIATKDFSKLWPKIKEALPELIPVVIKCITENDVNLQSIQPIVIHWTELINPTIQYLPKMPETYEECIKICDTRYNYPNKKCHSECEVWFKNK